MWIGFEELRGLKVSAAGNEVGVADDALFDARDQRGVYLVVDVRTWWAGRVVLVPFELVKAPDQAGGTVLLNLEGERIRKAPSIRQAPPLARDMAARAATGVGWRRTSWGGFIGTTSGEQPAPEPERPEGEESESVLHSALELGGYRVSAEDGQLGRVRDLLFGDDWRVRALVVETGDWLFPERVAVPARAIAELSSTEQVVRLNLTRAEVRRSPALHGSAQERAALERRFGVANGSG
jgi:uncharacterized protein YrrD